MLPIERPAKGFTTRFAPAPTGLLHLGHVASAIAVWGVARAFGGRVLLRIEDHDKIRSRPEYEAAILEDLCDLGFQPDEPVVRQSDRDGKYREALSRLESRGLVYPCGCSRKAIEAAAGPRALELRYPGTCRDRAVDPGSVSGRRVRLDPAVIAFRDLRLGEIEQNPSEQCGDVLIQDRDGHWTYQFAAVVDDIDQGVDLVVRGEDLLASTGRQIQIASLLGRKTPPRFLHHALMTRPDGHKLSKSNRDTGVRELRSAGWSVERVLGQAAAVLGLTAGEPVDLKTLVSRIQAP